MAGAMKKKPREVFVEITVRSYEGRQQDLKPFVDAADVAVRRLCGERSVFYGLIGRRAVVSRQTFARHMTRHGFYGKGR
jgi:hypothetical protein